MLSAKFVKGKKETACDNGLAAALDAVFGPGSNDKDAAAKVLSQVWPQVSKEAGDFEKIIIEGEGPRIVKGDSVTFPYTVEVLNLNLQAVLSGVVEMEKAHDEYLRRIETQKALYKQARMITWKGYEPGKRGRTASNRFGDILAKYGNQPAK